MNDSAIFVTIVANYMYGSSFTNCLLHFEGENVFGSFKRLTYCPPSTDNDSHCLGCENSFRPRVIVFATKPNIVEDVHMQQLPFGFSKLLPLVF